VEEKLLLVAGRMRRRGRLSLVEDEEEEEGTYPLEDELRLPQVWQLHAHHQDEVGGA
jgi:hypothetical protein